MSRRFFTSDPHLMHPFVAGLRGYASAEDHDRQFVESWRETVAPRDTVWVLGDLTIRHTDEVLGVFADLPGTKHLIVGNHDLCSPVSSQAHKHQRAYFRVFDSVQQAAQIKIAGRRVMMSHYPYEGDHAGRGDRCTQWRLRDEGAPLLCGHVHDEWRTSGNQFNVGVDHSTLLRPVAETEIAAWLRGLGR